MGKRWNAFFLHIRVIYFNLRCQENSTLIVYLLFFFFSSSEQVRIILRLLKLCPCAWTELSENKVEIEIALGKSKSYQIIVQKRSSVFGHCGRRNECFTELLLSALGGFALVSTLTNVVHHTESVFCLCYSKD